MKKHRTGLSRREFVESFSTATLAAGALASGTVRASTPVEKPVPRHWQSTWTPETPRRLGDLTHALAERAMGGAHGRSLARDLPPLPDGAFEGLTKNEAYVLAAKHAARVAPLRILPGERVVGSATLYEAARHVTPFLGVASTSHTTLGFDRVLHTGYRGLRERIEKRLAEGFEDEPLVEAAPAPKPEETRCEGRQGDAFLTSPGGAYWRETASTESLCRPPLFVECWARLDSAAGFNVLVLNKSKDSRHHWEIYSYAGSGCFSAYLPGHAPSEVVSDRVITDGAWHHLAMALTVGKVRLFVDGDLVREAEVVAKETGSEGRGGLYFGGFPWGPVGCHGAMDSVHISRRIPDHIEAVASFAPDEGTLGLWKLANAGDDAPLRHGAPLDGSVPPRNRGKDLLEAMLGCLDAERMWRQRHLDLLEERIAASTGEEQATYRRVRANLEQVPENPPRTFEEAVQSLWFMYAFQRLMGTWSGIGRIDEMLGGYLAADLEAGRTTLAEAREVLAHFWIKGCEWTGAHGFGGSGDAQFYQNIILAGVDEKGREVANEVTCLVLDIVEELHISDFPIAVRLNRNSPAALLRKMARVQRHGGGIVALYNEEVVIDGLVKFGYRLRDARRFTNDGCWEVLIPGETTFSYVPFDALGLLQGALHLDRPNAAPPDFATFDDLYRAYTERLARHIEGHHRMADGWMRSDHPAPLVSMFVEDCIDRGRSYYNRGARYSVLAPHAGGLANVANSLLVLKELVYDERCLSLADFVSILRDDWEGQEALRRLVLNRFEFYGNDSEQADAMMTRVFNDYTDLVARCPERAGVLRPAGISTFGREIAWRGPDGGRTASPDGHHGDEILATNFSPSPGTDRRGPTAVIKSYCKMDFTRTPNGATVELKIHPETVKGESGVEAMAGLMRGFVKLGGMFMHIDVVDSALLLDAQRHPEKYPNLSVRIAGWSARFATLNKEWQDMVIARTQQYV